MTVTFRKFATALVLVLGIAAIPAQKADAQASLSPEIQTAIASAMNAEGGPDLTALNGLMAANPAIAGDIASAAGALQPSLAAAIGGQAAAVLNTARIPDAVKAQQIASAGRGLAAANPDAAVTIFTSMSNVAPQFAGDAAGGIAQGAPQQATTVTRALSQVSPAAGPQTANNAPPPADSDPVDTSEDPDPVTN